MTSRTPRGAARTRIDPDRRRYRELRLAAVALPFLLFMANLEMLLA